MKKRDIICLIFLLCVITIFFRPVFLQNLIPVPTDTLVNLNYPYRDFYAANYPRGVPYKNPLVSDPVLQQIPWKNLSLSLLSKAQLPLWNPYQMAGYPLLGIIQSAPFYPLNILFALLPFIPAWTIFIFLQQVLAGLFMYWYLRNKDLSEEASIFGALSFSFSGFMIAWLEWGTIAHTALWLPLGLLAIDKICKGHGRKWNLILALSIIFSFLGGHLQTFIYSTGLLVVYFIFQLIKVNKKKTVLYSTLLTLLVSLLIILPILIPQLQLIGLSARNVDMSWQKEGWFIPVNQLLQFFAPDFFGNPATGNYWGVFNYGEFIGYIGIAPLLLAFFAIFYKRSRDIIFWGILFLFVLIFASSNVIAAFPYQLGIPFFTSTQPTRLIFLAEVALSILAANGFDNVLKAKKKSFIKPLASLGVLVILLYGIIFLTLKNIDPLNLSVTKHNLILPTILCLFTFSIFTLAFFLESKKKQLVLISLLVVTAVDLLFFAGKYTPFSKQEYFYPTTKVLKFLQSQPGQFRVMTTDRSILSPNITTMYHIQSIDGYDPLYLQRFGELAAASERGKPDISSPFGFNRIVVPIQLKSPIINLLGVKYILSLTDLKEPNLTKVAEEGQTKVYENAKAYPRAFLVGKIIKVTNKETAIKDIFNPALDLTQNAIVEDADAIPALVSSSGNVKITSYSENQVSLKTVTTSTGFVVLTDTYYPTWKVYVDGIEEKIYRTDYNFRGVVVPAGEHIVEFRDQLL